MESITKYDESRGLVYGWANKIALPDGSLVVDSQDDVIEPSELDAAVVEFMLHHRAVDEMHTEPVVGAIVESIVVTPEKLSAMGVPADVAKAMPTGWWVGAKVPPAVMAKVKSGEYAAWSIGGFATKVPV